MKISKQLYVIKIGGELISKPEILHALCKEIAKLKQANLNIVLVHGGGIQTSEMEIKLGNKPTIIAGRRVTDEKTIETIKMVIAGKINIEILSTLQTNGVAAVGLSGVDGNILNVHRRPPKKIINENSKQDQMIDYGLVADILAVNPELMLTLIDNHFLPVVAPLAADKQGNIYNINADTVASTIALSLQAVQWIILTNIDGVYDQKGNTLAHLTCHSARELIDQGIVTNGMIPKIESIITAIEAGIKSVHIINGLKPEKLQKLFVEKSLGTLITNEGR